MDKNQSIGVNNTLPWKLSADLARFKSITMGKPIIMGRKTYDSIGRPLPGRLNIVISRDTNLQIAGCEVVNSIEAGLELVKGQPELIVIGGASFYEQMLDSADYLEITYVDTKVDGDAFFPKFSLNNWQETARSDHLADSKNEFNYSFVSYKRKIHSDCFI